MSFWTDERKAIVRRMWEIEGASATDVAIALGEGCTRNAVIGVVARMGLAKRRTPHAAKRTPQQAPRPRRGAGQVAAPPRQRQPQGGLAASLGLTFAMAPRSPAATDPMVPPPPPGDGSADVRNQAIFSPARAPADARVVVLEELDRGDCKWPLFRDDDPVRLFCGAPAVPKPDGYHPYCAFHMRRARG